MQRVMDYCMQEKKTLDEETGIRWVSGVNCDGLNSVMEFETTKAVWNKDDGIRFYQYVQSFSPEEAITHKQAHKIALEFATKAWPGHEVLVATHCDAAHIHSHFVINSVSFETGLKLRQHPTTLLALRQLNDEICAAHGFSTLKPYEKGGTKISAREYRVAVSGESWKFQLMYHIGEAMKRSPTKADFIREMKQRNYDVTWTDERKYITYTCPNGKRCRGIKLHEEKYKKEMMELEFTIRAEQAESYVAIATGAAQRSELGNQGAYPLSAHGVRHPGGVAQEGRTAAGRRSTVPADAVPADRTVGHILGHRGDAEHGTAEVLPAMHQHGGQSGTPPTTGWEEERGILFGLVQEALRKPAGSAQHQGRAGTNLPQMGAHYGGGVDGIFDAGLRAMSAFGQLTEGDDDEDEHRKRIQSQEGSSAAGTALGLAIGALLAIRDEEQRRAEVVLQKEYENEQQSIWQLSM
jgi:hypothetical protein